MAKGNNQKIKIIKLLEILNSESDEKHPITTQQLVLRLNSMDIDVERKTVYDDVNALITCGFDIVSTKIGHSNAYYIGSRKFELSEIKILLDAVESASFITEKKSKVLSQKLLELVDVHNAEMLEKQVLFDNVVKHSNEKIYYNVDAISNAIIEEKRIEFCYFVHDVDGNIVLKRNGAKYLVSPWKLIFTENNYYLIGVLEEEKEFRHFRLDRMQSVEILESKICETVAREKRRIVGDTKRIFSMFKGEEKTVELVADNTLVDVIMDKFGENIKMTKLNEKQFSVLVRVEISDMFFAWCFGVGEKLKINAPFEVVNAFKEKFVSYQKHCFET